MGLLGVCRINLIFERLGNWQVEVPLPIHFPCCKKKTTRTRPAQAHEFIVAGPPSFRLTTALIPASAGHLLNLSNFSELLDYNLGASKFQVTCCPEMKTRSLHASVHESVNKSKSFESKIWVEDYMCMGGTVMCESSKQYR